MARNRKRAKERRARRPQPIATARGNHEADAPEPIAHAAPDVELAEAQLALGRPDLADAKPEQSSEELAAEPIGGGDGGGRVAVGAEFADDEDDVGAGAVVAHPASRPVPGNRLVNFIQGSWRELQRVQWPDRRQVMQATGVVIGFVIVAGVFLGVADFLAGKLMNYILTGHFK